MIFSAMRTSTTFRCILVMALACAFVICVVPNAFGAFSASSKILGVGRIQSAAPVETTFSSEQKLSFEAIDVATNVKTTETIVAPIERSVVVAEPEVEVSTLLPSASSNAASTSMSSDASTEAVGSWMTGKASAYAPSSNGGNSTASGTILTDESLTVAVPKEWKYLLGSTVEISYGGETVTALVTDTGGFLKYGRSLDLAPGVWKAFGFDSVSGWGVRTVQWRVI